ncbi:MAG: radical SAM protein, partial [Firmicutes bacterium]|nr:radical SAM protein [Bacillota bacterium]
YDDVTELSYKIIEKLNSNGIKCTALSKGVLPEKLKNLSKKNEYGITLVSLCENFRKENEPGAAPYIERIEALKRLHEAGCKTWVSIEPYPTPNFIEQDINEILKTVSFVDKIIFGRLNYNAKVSAYKSHREFFNEMSDVVIAFCEKNKIAYHIKDGTITITKQTA